MVMKHQQYSLVFYTCKSKTVHVYVIQAVTFSKKTDRWFLGYQQPCHTQKMSRLPSPNLPPSVARFGRWWPHQKVVEPTNCSRGTPDDVFSPAVTSPEWKNPKKPSKDLTTNPEFPKVFWTLMVGRWNFFLKWSLLRGYLFIWFSGGLGGFPWFLEFLSRKIPIVTEVETTNYTPVNWNSNGKWTRIEDVFPVEHGDFRLLCQFTRG